MTKDEELTRYMAVIEQYKEQMNSLDMQASYIQAAIMDYNKAKMTLEQLSKTNKNDEILLPIGGSTFIKASTTDSSKVLFDIGAGLVCEKTSQDAVKKIDSRIEDLQKTQEKLSTIMQNLQNEATEVYAKAQRLLVEKRQNE
jgi:prefoldin alpha subunit